MLSSVITAAAIAALSAQAGPLDVEGVWLTDEQDSKVEITTCADGTPCGRVVWVSPQALEPERRNTVLRDRNNPDAAQQDRPIIGLDILSGFEEGGRRWRRGEIYDPEGGDTYRSSLKRLSEDTLEVQGCVTIICRDLIWTRSSLTDEDKAEAAAHAP